MRAIQVRQSGLRKNCSSICPVSTKGAAVQSPISRLQARDLRDAGWLAGGN